MATPGGSGVDTDKYYKRRTRLCGWELSAKVVAGWTLRSAGLPGWHIECSAMSIKYLAKFESTPAARPAVPASRERDAQSKDHGQAVLEIWITAFLRSRRNMSNQGQFLYVPICATSVFALAIIISAFGPTKAVDFIQTAGAESQSRAENFPVARPGCENDEGSDPPVSELTAKAFAVFDRRWTPI